MADLLNSPGILVGFNSAIPLIPKITIPDGRTVERPVPSYMRQCVRWFWLRDSYEGGETYRNARYGIDSYGFPIRNMVRHKREYPSPADISNKQGVNGRPPGTDMSAQATDDDYEMRRARTVVYTFTSESIKEHLAKIYKLEIKRTTTNPVLEKFWKDVDTCGTTIDKWMSETSACMFALFGMLDLFFDKPPIPAEAKGRPLSMADEISMRLKDVTVSYILPMNIPWYRTDRRNRYTECIVAEHTQDETCNFRYWNANQWELYDGEGTRMDGDFHTYGRVPIVRAFHRKRISDQFVGLPPYEGIAEIQREYYNRDSELVLSDSLQAHPSIQGPDDYLLKDGSIIIGPGWALPKKKNVEGGTATYEGWDYLQPPKEGADSIRQNKMDLRDNADRAAARTKPAGVTGSSASTVSQSGESKKMDQQNGNALLSEMSIALESMEMLIAEFVIAIGGTPVPDPKSYTVAYPRQFNLKDADEIMVSHQQYLMNLSLAGMTPLVDAAVFKQYVREALVGQDDALYLEYDAEIDAFLTQANEQRDREKEASLTMVEKAAENPPADNAPPGNA